MKTWSDLITAWGGPTKFADDIGVSFDAAAKMRQRNSVHVDYWPLIIARAPMAGINGVTWEFLATLRKGHAAQPGQRDDRFRRPFAGQIMPV